MNHNDGIFTIIELDDQYVLSSSKYTQKACELYKVLDVYVGTHVHGDVNASAFQSLCGNYIRKVGTVSDIINDIKNTTNLKNLYNPNTNSNVNKEPSPFTFGSIYFSKLDEPSSLLPFQTQKIDTEISNFAYVPCAASVEKEDTYVLFNKKYKKHVIVVISGRILANEFIPSFDEFEIVGKVTATEYTSLNDILKNCTSRDDLDNKLNSYNVLYGDNTPQRDLSNKVNEELKSKVLAVVKGGYEITQQPQHRIKTTEVVDLAEKLVYAVGTRHYISKKMPQYLEELGVERKRYTDGWYFVGLKNKI